MAKQKKHNLIARTWKKCKDAKTLKMWDEVLRVCEDIYPNSTANLDLTLYENHAHRILGQCRHDVVCGKVLSAICINRCMYSRSSKEIRDTLIHEVAHAVEPRDHHGAKWKRAGDKIGKRWGITVTRCGVLTTKPNEQPYTLCCTRCSKTYKQFRVCRSVEHPHLFTCGVCGAPLRLGYILGTPTERFEHGRVPKEAEKYVKRLVGVYAADEYQYVPDAMKAIVERYGKEVM